MLRLIEDVPCLTIFVIKNKGVTSVTAFKNLLTEFKLLLRNLPSLITALFVTSVVSMNLLANKSIDLHLHWLALDCGILFSWLAFLLMDIVTKRFGVRAANELSVVALLINLLFSAFFIAASFIPGTWSQSYVKVAGGMDLINAALDGTFRSAWYVIFGSSIAFAASALANNFLNACFSRMIGKNNFLAFSVSAYLSTLLAQFADNLLFAFIVSYNFFGWTPLQCVMCAVTGAVAELLFEVIFSPVGYRVVRRLEKENVGREYLAYIALKKAGSEEAKG